MDLDMWKHPSTISNLEKLKSYNNYLIPVGTGELASGLFGEGRMAEPIDIARTLEEFFHRQQDLVGKKILITAGPTYESIDPVRFIGNHSSGKMGISLANECAARGAEVYLVMGPSFQKSSHKGIKRIDVVSAEDMYQASLKIYSKVDVAIFAAAVADFTPIEKATQKIKKKANEEKRTLTLIRTKDIAAELGKIKNIHQINVGFALETENEESNALRKLIKKNFDLIIMNSMADSGAGFKHDTNKITIYHKNGQKTAFSLKQKNEVAKDIVNEVIKLQQSSI
jgi:phosphopantothenoylcysteine decarboxylase/phosphopantothenate--cysteine ligase